MPETEQEAMTRGGNMLDGIAKRMQAGPNSYDESRQILKDLTLAMALSNKVDGYREHGKVLMDIAKWWWIDMTIQEVNKTFDRLLLAQKEHTEIQTRRLDAQVRIAEAEASRALSKSASSADDAKFAKKFMWGEIGLAVLVFIATVAQVYIQYLDHQENAKYREGSIVPSTSVSKVP